MSALHFLSPLLIFFIVPRRPCHFYDPTEPLPWVAAKPPWVPEPGVSLHSSVVLRAPVRPSPSVPAAVQGHVALSRGHSGWTKARSQLRGRERVHGGLHSPQNFISGQEGQGLQQIRDVACHSVQPLLAPWGVQSFGAEKEKPISSFHSWGHGSAKAQGDRCLRWWQRLGWCLSLFLEDLERGSETSPKSRALEQEMWGEGGCRTGPCHTDAGLAKARATPTPPGKL